MDENFDNNGLNERIETSDIEMSETDTTDAETSGTETDGMALTQKKPNKFCNWLNRYFHFYERGGTVKGELVAGLSVFLISVCALFMNITILTSVFADDVPYLGMYLGATIVSFIGTLLIGLLANRPLVQCASLSMSSVFISMIGANSGLTYTNLLAVTFICAIVYVVLVSIPVVNRFMNKMLPAGVKKALPVAMGLYVCYYALQNMGLTSLITDPNAITTRPEFTVYCIVIGAISILIVALFKYRKSKHPYLYGFGIGMLLFYLIPVFTGTSGSIFTEVYSLNRIYIGMNLDPNGEIYTIGLAWNEMLLGNVFTTGFDFSAFTEAGGSVAALFIEGILVFMFMGMYESEAATTATLSDEDNSEYGQKVMGRVLLANSITNVVAPIFGVAPMSVGKESPIASGDNGKSGLTSVFCAIGYLIAIFTWALFILLATNIPTVPEYGHAGFLFPAVVDSLFQVADAVMLVVGASALIKLKAVNWDDIEEVIVCAVTIVVAVFTFNIVYGVACGVIIYVLGQLLSFKKAEIKKISIPTIVLAVLMVVVGVFVFI